VKTDIKNDHPYQKPFNNFPDIKFDSIVFNITLSEDIPSVAKLENN
jgi:hypothetical protein